MRIAIAGVLHESNTFLSVPTSIDRFRESSLLEGEAIEPAWHNAPHEWAGFFEGAEANHFEPVPLLVAHAMPSGTLTAPCFEEIASRIIELLRRAGTVDGVLLGLHGATVSAPYRDADGEIIFRVRQAVGPDMPIIVTLDCHANVSRKMFVNATAIVIYGTCPHLDQKQRGLEAAELIARTVRREVRPTGWLETPPVCINITRQHTDHFPATEVRRDMLAARGRSGILSASFALGFPYADVPEMGMAFLAYSDGNPGVAKDAAVWMARSAWDRRYEYLTDAMPVEMAVREAAASRIRPVVLNDVGDNVGGGSAADSTFLLAEAYRQNARGMCIVLADPEAVRVCVAAGVGATVSLMVGGKTDRLHGAPVAITGSVRTISDGQFTESEVRHMGMKNFDQGTTAVVETAEEHTVVLTTYRQAPSSLHQILHLGIRPAQKQMIVAKGVILPRPAYDPVAERTIYVNTPGSTTAAIEGLEYSQRRKAMFPFDYAAKYEPGSGPTV